MERQYDFQDMQKKQEQTQEIDWSQYKEAEPAKPGDKADAVVVSVVKGKLADFLSSEALQKWNADPGQPAVQVTVEGEAQGFKVRESKILTLPNDGIIRKNSNLYKWKKLFGDYPHVGQKVFLIANSEGYFKLTL